MIRLKLFFIQLFVGALCGGLFFTSCKEDNNEVLPPEPVIEVGSPNRTVLLYIIGDNSLSQYANRNIDSIASGMAKINTTLQMLVYQDSNDRMPTLWKIEHTAGGDVIRKPVKEWNEDIDSADPEIMVSILKEVFTDYPADEKGLILWSHGTGWIPASTTLLSAPMQKSFGPDKKSYLELWDVRTILENTGLHFDFICFDACLMAGVEVAYELKEVTDYLIVSPTEIMGVGFPYQTIVPVLGRTQLDLTAVCESYMHFFNGNPGRDGTISLIKTASLDALASGYAEILRRGEVGAALQSHTIQQMGRKIPFSTADYTDIFYDMGNVVSLLVDANNHPFFDLMNRVVLYKDNTTRFSTFDISQNSGLTVFVPELSDNEYYKGVYPMLRWYQATR